MKIAYLIYEDLYSNTGVIKKITSQVNMWKQKGCDVKVFSIFNYKRSDLVKRKSLSFEYEIFRSSIACDIIKVKSIYWNLLFTHGDLRRSLRDFGPDIVYYRPIFMWYPGQAGLYKEFKTVLEVNTIDKEEIKLYSSLLRFNYLFGRESINKSMSGYVGVTNEISALYSEYRKPATTISNGIDMNAQSSRVVGERLRNLRPQLIMVASAGIMNTWHGVDKYLRMCARIPEFDFHLVGPAIEGGHDNIPPNLTVHGYLQREQLMELYDKMDIGVGSLALHRIGIQEACPLKTREYAAMGLPMILGYSDTDLDGQEFILNIGNSEDNVEKNTERIVAFVKKWQNIRVSKDKVIPLVGLEIKEEQRIRFLSSIV